MLLVINFVTNLGYFTLGCVVSAVGIPLVPGGGMYQDSAEPVPPGKVVSLVLIYFYPQSTSFK